MGQAHPFQRVAFPQRNGNQPRRAHRREFLQRHPLDHALPRGHEAIFSLREIGHSHCCGHPLAGFHVQQVDDGHPFPRAARLGNLIGFGGIHLAAVGEKKHRMERAGRDEQDHLIVFLGGVAGHPAPPAPLRPESTRWHPLDVPALGEGNQHWHVGHQVFFPNVGAGVAGNQGAALIAVFLGHFFQIGLDDGQDFLRMRQQVFQVGDAFLDLAIFIFNLLAFQRGQAAQGHIENGLRLHFGEAETPHQPLTRLVGIVRGADGRDDVIEVRQGQQQPFENVRPFAGFRQFVFAAAADDFPPVLDVNLHGPLEGKQPRLAIDQGQQLHAESGLQRGVLVKLVEHFVRLGVALEFNHNAHAAAVGFVAQVGDCVDVAFPHQLGNAGDERRFVHLVGNLSNHDAVTPALHFFDVGARPHHDAPPAVGVGLADALRAHDDAAGGEVGPFDELQQIVHADVV